MGSIGGDHSACRAARTEGEGSECCRLVLRGLDRYVRLPRFGAQPTWRMSRDWSARLERAVPGGAAAALSLQSFDMQAQHEIRSRQSKDVVARREDSGTSEHVSTVFYKYAPSCMHHGDRGYDVTDPGLTDGQRNRIAFPRKWIDVDKKAKYLKAMGRRHGPDEWPTDVGIHGTDVRGEREGGAAKL